MGEHGEQGANTGDAYVAGQSIDPTVVEQADERETDEEAAETPADDSPATDAE